MSDVAWLKAAWRLDMHDQKQNVRMQTFLHWFNSRNMSVAFDTKQTGYRSCRVDLLVKAVSDNSEVARVRSYFGAAEWRLGSWAFALLQKAQRVVLEGEGCLR